MNDEFNWGYTRPKTDTVGKHTPGPWVSDEYGVIISTGSIMDSIAEIYLHKAGSEKLKQIDPTWEGRQKANAQLIAAAPDSNRANKISFSVLTDVYQHLYMNPSTDPALENLMDSVKRALTANREAIAKAEGRV